MNNVLLAIDDTKGSIKTIEGLAKVMCDCRPAKLALLYVQKLEGKSVMDELILSDSELETLKESMQGTEYQEQLDQRAGKILDYFQEALQKKGFTTTKAIVKQGHPAEEIVKTAEEENVDMIVIGSRGKRLHDLFLGSISREVSNKANVSVLLIK